MLWTLDEATKLIAQIEKEVSALGFHCGLTGSILLKGESNHDLDIIIYPHDTSSSVLNEATSALANILIKKVTRGRVAAYWERRQISNDTKHVEIWETKDGKRVDVFFLR